ncbi:hypothetical protein RHMOL_Rhmol02G0271800 [Rhododendron molle]|uniref:Uncharacterized protein n=1 Tax=Rhododendron molle TaxID=49168 RepID=A0ACC0PWC2_RHOML|nr:hypothetical protein RHMOL_Rhmol02G0271800 [Rhododendron molle]
MHLWLLFEVHLPFPDLFAASFCAVVASGLGVSLSPGSSMTVSVYSADSSGLGALSLRVQHCICCCCFGWWTILVALSTPKSLGRLRENRFIYSHADFNEDQVNAFHCDVMTHDLCDTMMPSSINVVTFLSKEDALDTKECQESIKGAGFTIVDVDIYSRVSRQIQNCS